MAGINRKNWKLVGLLMMTTLALVILWSQRALHSKVDTTLPTVDTLQHQPSEKLRLSTLTPPSLEKPPPAAFKLLPAEKYLPYFTYSGIKMFKSGQCTCDSQDGLSVNNLQDNFTPEEIQSVKQRRKKEIEHYKKRYRSIPADVLIAKPNSPLSYPVYGVEVLPLATIRLAGLGVHVPKGMLFEVMLAASQGTFNTLADVSDSVFHGRGTKKVTITSSDIELVNFILQYTTYTSVVYHIHMVDTVTFVMGPHTAQFPVVIRQPSMPILYDPGEERSINSLVTIATKTFLRYDKLRTLIRSIREYYKNITIIVADDNDVLEKIEDPNVEQYFMPFAKGWFAGRNLAVSQVTTKYFLWVDDDFLFTEMTNLEKLVNILEKTNLDMVGGNVNGNSFSFQLLYKEGDEDGDCVHIRGGSYGAIDGFPNCVLSSAVVNFFLAHTVRVQRVGFDPKLTRVAHTEFFIDGLGSLLIGSCRDIVISHQKHSNPLLTLTDKKNQRYKDFRSNTKDLVTLKLKLHYFKNYLKCFTKK